MFKNNNILVGKNENKEAILLLNKACQHGLITGASGSGKTITLKTLAEAFSDANVPVIITDVKGDLAGCAKCGEMNENITSRVNELKLEGFVPKQYPTTFLDVYGTSGHPVRTTVSILGARILSRMLSLSDTQEGVLTIIFKIAKDNNVELVTLDDLRKYVNYVGEHHKEYTLSYGNVSTQSVGSIQRAILTLQEEDGDTFFGKPAFDINDLIYSNGMNGMINILHCVRLFNNPTLYSSVLLWLLDSLYDNLPEVGEIDKPKLVVFLDEAHLLFDDMPEHLLKQIIQIVKLIRSKGVALFFISQTPNDIPQDILSQLSNRIQHVLRSYTPADDKIIKSVAESFRADNSFDVIDTLKTLGTGEALISTLNEDGEPTIVDKYTILPPLSKIGTIEDYDRGYIMQTSRLKNKYDQKIITEIVLPTQKEEIKVTEEVKKEDKRKTSEVNKFQKKLVNKFENKLANKIINKFFK